MSITKNLIFLLKSQSNDEKDDKYEIILRENGFQVIQVKTIDFKYKNLNLLENKLKCPNDYAGMILSSPRCVLAVKYACKLPNEWKLKENYVVGEATYELALKELDVECGGKETGNADNLSIRLLNNSDKIAKRFLYPHGNLKMDILKNKLSKSSITLEEVEVYETVTNEHIEEDFGKVTESLNVFPEYIVFFSPSGLKAIETILFQLPLNSMKLIAIGPTTESAMIKLGLTVFGVAEKPTPSDVLKLLK
nr:uroporphyrinogen-III synthase-like [Onthophagus taurus]